MAQYDGSIRINTEIKIKNAQIQLSTLENRIVKTADKVDSLRAELDAMKDVKIPTQAFTDLEKEIKKAESEYEKLQEKLDNPGKPTDKYKNLLSELQKAQNELEKLIKEQNTWDEIGVPKGSVWDDLNEKVANASDKVDELKEKMFSLEESKEAFELKVDIKEVEEARKKVDELKKEMEELKSSGGDFVFGVDTDEYAKKSQQLKYAEKDLESLNEKYDLQTLKIKQLNNETGKTQKTYKKFGEVSKKISSIFQKLGKSVQKIIGGFRKLGNAISGTFKKGISFIGSFSNKIKELAQRHMPRLQKETERTKSSIHGFGRRIKDLVLSALIFNQISAAFRSMIEGMKEGFVNFYNWSSGFKSSVDNLKASILTLKNALAAAFSPIVELAIPYIQKLVEWITRATDKVGQLIAALTGRKTYTRAIKQTAKATEEETESTKKNTKATKEAKEELEGYLSPLDEINKYREDKPTASSVENPKLDEITPEDEVKDMFEEAPIDGYFQNLADKIKDILGKVFEPLKKAWKREGKFVIDSWKYALKEIWKLIKDIGRDFLKVWRQPATVDMLSDMLHILGDIGLIVGNIAKNFRIAWNYNNTGLHILENIRDIFAAIIHNIRLAADYTVEWSKNLDFRPLLTSIEVLTRSLVRFADFLSGTMVDFYTEFILPLTSWTISEKGLPRLFNILAAFMNEINWEGLRSSLKSLYQALEPYAEEIGNGLLDFIEKIKDEGVEFFNFLPGAIQRAADALKSGDLATAFYEFGSIAGEAVKHAFNTIKIAIESIPWGEIGTWIASFINGIDWMGVGQSLFGALVSAINGAISLLHNFIMTMDWTSLGTALGANLQNAWNSINWQQAGETIGAGIRGILNFLLTTVQEMDWEQIGRDIGTLLSEIPWGEIFTQVFTIIWEVLSGLISGLLDTNAGKVILAIGSGILAIKGLFNVADFALTIAQWATGGTSKFSLLSQGAELLKNTLGGITGAIGTLFSPTGLMIAAIAAGALLIITHWDDIKEAAGKLKDKIAEKWEGIKEATGKLKDRLVEKVTEIKDKVGEKFNDMGTKAKKITRDMSDNVEGKFGSMGGKLRELAQKMAGNVGEKFSDMKYDAESITQKISEGVGNRFSNISDSINRFLGNAKNSWSNTWNNMGNIVSSALSSIKKVVSSVFDWIVGGIDNLFQSLDKLSNKVSKTTSIKGKGVGSKISGAISSRSSIYQNDFSALGNMEIPGYATGQVIPRSMKQHLAILGDNTRETEVVSPLSTIRQALREEAISLGLGGDVGNENLTLKVYLQDDQLFNSKKIFEAVIKQGKIEQMSSGKNRLLLEN